MTQASPSSSEVRVPLGYPCTTIYVDESGGGVHGRFFVVGALKVRKHGDFSRALQAVRDRTGFVQEFHFTEITRAKLPAYFELVDTVASLDVQFHACLVDRELFDPSAVCSSVWQAHAEVTAQLLRGAINRKELVSVLMDTISTPANVAYEDYVRREVNSPFRSTSVVTAALLDSRACVGLQAVDVLAGALMWERRAAADGKRPSNPKCKVVDRVKQRFNVALADGRTPRTNIRTLQRLPRKLQRELLALPAASGS